MKAYAIKRQIYRNQTLKGVTLFLFFILGNVSNHVITLFKRDFQMLTGCNLEYKLGRSEIVPQNAGQMVPDGSGRIE
jgi:hypothetical protein